MPGRGIVISGLGIGQIFAWGSSYYLPAVLAKPIVDDTGWPLAWVIGGLSIGLLVAGLVSPWMGRTIARRGGRPVLMASTVLLAAGLCMLALAPSIPVYLSAWVVVGIGMGAGLYDPAFASLGRLYGEAARSAITTLTLFGGFASTVCWPLSAFLVIHFGWRGTCFAYAAFNLAILLPLYGVALPREAEHAAPRAVTVAIRKEAREPGVRQTRLLFIVLATAITMSAMISTLLSVHLLTILQSRGVGLTAAVALGRTRRAISGRCSHHRISNCALSSSHLDQTRLYPSGRGWHRGLVGVAAVPRPWSSTEPESALNPSRAARSRSSSSRVRDTRRCWVGWPCRASWRKPRPLQLVRRC
jgi:MFS family permease